MTSRKHARGFTLLESMISMVVVTVGLLGVVPMISMASNRDADGRKIDRATSVAYGVLNHLQRLPFDALELQDASTGNGTDLMDVAGSFSGANTVPVQGAFDGQALTTGPELVANPTVKFDGYAIAGAGSSRPTLDFNGDGKPDFHIFWVIKPEPPDPTINGIIPGKRIAVIVSWRDPLSGRQKRTVVVGYRANVRAILP